MFSVGVLWDYHKKLIKLIRINKKAPGNIKANVDELLIPSIRQYMIVEQVNSSWQKVGHDMK